MRKKKGFDDVIKLLVYAEEEEESNIPLNLFRKFMIMCVFSIVSTEVANVYILRLFSMQEPVDIGRLTLRQVPQEFVWCTYSQQISEV